MGKASEGKKSENTSDKKSVGDNLPQEGRISEEQKIKIGHFCNKAGTVLLVLFFLVTCVVVTIDLTLYLTLTIIIAALFAACCVIGHICLKDYKPE